MSNLDPVAVVIGQGSNTRVVICARYCVDFVAEKVSGLIRFVEPEIHWSMTVRHSTSEAEEDCR